MPTPTVEPTVLNSLTERRAKLIEKWGDEITAREVERAEFEARGDDVAEADLEADKLAEDEFRGRSDQIERDIEALDVRIGDQKKLAERRKIAAEAAAEGGVITRQAEPLTYRRDNTKNQSYFRDLVAVMNSDAGASLQSVSLPEARDRLFRHAQEMDIEAPLRAEARAKRAQAQAEAAEDDVRRRYGFSARESFSPFERRVEPNRTLGQGGYFVPPLWLDDTIAGLRAGRVAAGLPRQMDLPPGTDSINVPKLGPTLTLTGVQGADNQPVASQDFTDTAVTANVKTIAGQSDIALQLLDQSPYSIDEVILNDLMADYNKRLDLQILQGNGSNSTALNGGQMLGVYPATNWPGTNSITYTDGSPAAWKLFSVFGAMASQIATNRFMLGDSLAYVLHPRRGFWFAAGTDSQNRPLVNPGDWGMNLQAANEGAIPAEGLVGRLPWQAPFYIDANVTTTDATGGTNQDVAIAAVWDDAWLFEGEMRTRVLPEVLSGTLAVRFQVYNYAAFLVRYGQSLAIATGTGFAAPQGAVSSVLF